MVQGGVIMSAIILFDKSGCVLPETNLTDPKALSRTMHSVYERHIC